jgi:hypothetical protein
MTSGHETDREWMGSSVGQVVRTIVDDGGLVRPNVGVNKTGYSRD